MTKTSKTIVFFGNERLATGVHTTAETLRALIAAGYTVAAVVSNYEPGQSRNARALEIETVAKEHNIPLLLPEKPKDILEQLQEYNAEAGVLVAYGRIVPQSVIDVFPKGIVNIHPSLLPLHRGPTPIESVILEGAARTGVSIMALSKEMDAGGVYAQSEFPLTGTESKQQLADALLEVGKSMLFEVLPGILEGTVVALPQDDSRATYDRLITKEDGVIDWRKPARQLEREVRAYADWPKSRTVLAKRDVVITQASVSEAPLAAPGTVTTEGNTLLVACAEEALRIEKLKPAGKQEMTAEGFLAGYKQFLA